MITVSSFFQLDPWTHKNQLGVHEYKLKKTNVILNQCDSALISHLFHEINGVKKGSLHVTTFVYHDEGIVVHGAWNKLVWFGREGGDKNEIINKQIYSCFSKFDRQLFLLFNCEQKYKITNIYTLPLLLLFMSSF